MQMNYLFVIQLFFWISVLVSRSHCFWKWNFFGESCDEKSININMSGLKEEIKQNLYGQHLVELAVSKTLKAHLNRMEPKKALVLSFHGQTGSGKNHVSKMIVKHVYKKDSDSIFYHFYIGSIRFPHESEVTQYQAELQEEIKMHTKKCERSIFIFDEADKIPAGVLDALFPYLKPHEKIDGVDYRKNIFIFLSNTGARNISNVVQEFRKKGEERENITLKDLQHLISEGAYYEPGGFHKSKVVQEELINEYVPFLPLEKEHVKLCIASELRNRKLKGDIDMIADQLDYYPPTEELFSKSGCNHVYKKVDLYGEEY